MVKKIWASLRKLFAPSSV